MCICICICIHGLWYSIYRIGISHSFAVHACVTVRCCCVHLNFSLLSLPSPPHSLTSSLWWCVEFTSSYLILLVMHPRLLELSVDIYADSNRGINWDEPQTTARSTCSFVASYRIASQHIWSYRTIINNYIYIVILIYYISSFRIALYCILTCTYTCSNNHDAIMMQFWQHIHTYYTYNSNEMHMMSWWTYLAACVLSNSTVISMLIHSISINTDVSWWYASSQAFLAQYLLLRSNLPNRDALCALILQHADVQNNDDDDIIPTTTHASSTRPLHSTTQINAALDSIHQQSSSSSSGLKIIIAGAPCSGKGTQCEVIKERYGVYHLSTGDLLRAEIANGTALGLQAKQYMDRGQLIPDHLIIDIVKEKVSTPDIQRRGFLLDGFPRTAVQAQALRQAGIEPDIFLQLNVPDQVLIQRVTGRRTDPTTGRSYHIQFDPPPKGEIADRCVQRSDDTEEKIVERLKAYHSAINAIATQYNHIKVEINGDRNKQLITNEIIEILDQVHANKEWMTFESPWYNDILDQFAMSWRIAFMITLARTHQSVHHTNWIIAPNPPSSSSSSSSSSTMSSSSSSSSFSMPDFENPPLSPWLHAHDQWHHHHHEHMHMHNVSRLRSRAWNLSSTRSNIQSIAIWELMKEIHDVSLFVVWIQAESKQIDFNWFQQSVVIRWWMRPRGESWMRVVGEYEGGREGEEERKLGLI